MNPSVLLTDLYELTMLQAYFQQRMNGTAVFELFVRTLPEHRNFLVAAGLQQVVDYLLELRFTDEECDWLRGSGRFTPAFVDSLADLRFRGHLDALPEGSIFFPHEPLLRVIAPLREAQLVESRIMNLVHFETIVATKAVRCRLAAPDALIVDFGLRRAHGSEAGLLSARASYIAGFDGTATLESGRRFGIPTYGTMAHSYVQVHEDELTAFESFARAHPDNAMLLIDTYDTERAARKVVALQRKLAPAGIRIKGVRIDSGDLAAHARNVRAILDAAGLTAVTIFGSSNLDEYRLRELVQGDAPIDGYGVGTRMNTSADAPYLDCAYKLQEYDGEPRRKRSEGKATWPGRKQVYRRYQHDGTFGDDLIALHDEPATGVPLLEPVLRDGRLVAPLPAIAESRVRTRTQLHALPAALKSLDSAPAYDVSLSPSIRRLAIALDAAIDSRQA